MPSKTHLYAVLLVASLLWSGFLIAEGVPVSTAWLRHLPTVTGALVLLVIAFDFWIWRLRFLQGWFVKRPVLAGTWRAALWLPEQEKPRQGYMVIRQTYTMLSLRLLTDESSSVTLAARLLRDPDGSYRVATVYRGEPQILLQDQSRIHHGALILQVAGAPAQSLKGHYWTDRDTKGEIELSDHRKRVFDDYSVARKEHKESK